MHTNYRPSLNHSHLYPNSIVRYNFSFFCVWEKWPTKMKVPSAGTQESRWISVLAHISQKAHLWGLLVMQQ